MAALQTLMWTFQSRIYENLRPNVQECVLNGVFSILYLFAAAWQFYQTFVNHSPTEFMCSTDGFDEELHCRLWQSQLVGCAACGVLFLLTTIYWIVLFRCRTLNIKDMASDGYITSSPTLTAARAKEEANRREKEEAEAIAAEAERRRLQHRQQQQQAQQQQQIQRQIPQPRPTNPYQQQQQHMMQNQNSSNYFNQGRQPTYPQPRVPPQTQGSYAVDNHNDGFYNDLYGVQQQQQYPYQAGPNASTGYHHGGSNVNMPIQYTEEPVGYLDTPGTTNLQHEQIDYAYGQFNPAETFDDPTSQEAQAHLAYANQLREQQLYHENMAQVLKKQQEQQQQKIRRSFEALNNSSRNNSTSNVAAAMPSGSSTSAAGPVSLPRPTSTSSVVGGGGGALAVPPPPSSGSTVNFPVPLQQDTTAGSGPLPVRPPPSSGSTVNFPMPLQHSATMPPLPSTTSSRVMNGSGATNGTPGYVDYPMAATSAQGGVTPGGSTTPRIVGSPQEYRNRPQLYGGDGATSSVYSDDRYKAELLADVRRERGLAQQGNMSPDARSDYHDYKVSVAGSDYGGDDSRAGIHSRKPQQQYEKQDGYVPPPGRSRTMWS
ncbi:hypothetical protein BGZ94_003790 [Podila epigama]|nr:hypothetical protein BGZ94_003790 [Podila epigama]